MFLTIPFTFQPILFLLHIAAIDQAQSSPKSSPNPRRTIVLLQPSAKMRDTVYVMEQQAQVYSARNVARHYGCDGR